jgi:hypothetical protein
MSDDARLARIFSDALAESAPGRASDRLRTEIKSTMSRTRPRPRWLALLKEPPMRTTSGVAVGSPTLRLASIMAATIALLLAAAAVTAGGATLIRNASSMALPHNNGLIALDAGTDQILVADRDGSNVQPLVTLGSDLRGPSWSPDGTKLAYFEIVAIGPEPDGTLAEVQVVDDDGGNDRELFG